mmetsp:Transcript_4730/g.11264  ORF Transcript_4730/g.11264 Transcript_4730/m.11264 type:complete len:102 (-) Transcript_4730:77-382(-)
MKNNRISILGQSHIKRKTKKSPGGKLIALKLQKKIKKKRCIDNGNILPGLISRNSNSHVKKSISRHSGGELSISALRNKIMKCFLREEKKLAKKILISKKN